MSGLKYPVVALAAFLATTSCFLLMQSLIVAEAERTRSAPVARVALSSRVMPTPEIVERKVRERPVRAVPAEPPPGPEGVPIPLEDIDPLTQAPRLVIGTLAPHADPDMRFDLSPPLRDLVPVFVVQPTYPFSAVMKEIEGFVVVSFDVRADGSVANPFVVSSEPKTLFDDAALAAIRKFRFEPRMAGGDRIGVNGLKLRFLFELDDELGVAVVR